MASDIPFHWPKKRSLFGVEVSVTCYCEVVDAVIAAAQSGRGGVATFLAVHGIVSAATDPEFGRRVNACQIVAPDGQPVRWALNFFHHAGLADRVYGPQVMRLVCRRCAELGLSVFLCGSTPQVACDAGDEPAGDVSGFEDRRRGIAAVPAAERGGKRRAVRPDQPKRRGGGVHRAGRSAARDVRGRQSE